MTSAALEKDGWVRTSRDGAVLTVTLDRADQLNAQTPATWSALAAVGESMDDEVRVVVLRGAGRSFSAGLDRSLFSPEPGVPGGLGDLVQALLAPPVGASRATAALVRSAVRNDFAAQDAAERAAQVQRLHDFVSGR